MATYKISDLYNMLGKIANDGYDYVDLHLLDGDDDTPEAINFEVFDPESLCGIDYEYVESCEIPNSYLEQPSNTFRGSDYCYKVNFTYQEIATIKHSVDNALEYFKELLKRPDCSREDACEIKNSSISCRNLQAKLAMFFKHVNNS